MRGLRQFAARRASTREQTRGRLDTSITSTRVSVTARDHDDPGPDFAQPFIWPVQGRISGRFGNARVYNSQPGAWQLRPARVSPM